MSKIHHFQPDLYYYTLAAHPAAIRMESGDTIITSTVDSRNMDAQGNEIPVDKRHQQPGNPLCQVNPLVGPVVIEGACPGDTLRVMIRRIEITREYALSRFSAGCGGARNESLLSISFLSYYEPLPDTLYRWGIDVNQRQCTLELSGRRAVLPLQPFIGTIGTAPRFGQSLSSLVPADHGGNMDLPETREGTSLYLPVFAEGGCLFLGDVHASQGDGELCGVALETTARVELKIDLLKGLALNWPRLESGTHWMTVGSSRTLTDAIKIAQAEMVLWLQAEFKMGCADCLQVISQGCEIRIGNVVNPNYTVAMKLLKGILQ